MKVKDIALPHLFPDFKLIGGAGGMEAEVKRIAVFDAPDMSYWLRGGEFIIGNGFIFKDDANAIPAFLEKMKESGVAAVGIKFDRFTAFADMAEISSVADSLGLPVFRIPFRYKWVYVINKFQTEMDRVDRAEDGTGGGEFLEELSDLGSLLQAVSSNIGKPLFFSTRANGEGAAFFPSRDFASPLRGSEEAYVRARVVESRPLPGIPKYLCVREEKRDFGSGVKTYIYFAENQPYFELHVIFGETDEISRRDEIIIKRAVSALKALLIEQAALYSQQYREISQAVERLVGGAYSDPDALMRTFRKWDLVSPLPCRIAVMPRRDAFSELIGAGDVPYRFYCSVGNLHILLIPWQTGRGGAEANAKALEHLEKYGEPAALGTVAHTIGEVPRSFHEARRVLDYMRRCVFADGVVMYEDVILELALEKMLETEDAAALYELYWKPLTKHGKRHSVALESFAAALADSGFNLTECAEKLDIHYNTARKYSDMMEAELGVSLHDFKTQLALYIARRKAAITPERPSLV